jgi:hypothetical protein
MVSTESAMHYSTFNGGNGDAEIKSRKLDAILSNNEENEAIEDVDDAFEQLVVRLCSYKVWPKCSKN